MVSKSDAGGAICLSGTQLALVTRHLPSPRALEPVGWPLSADQLKRLDEVSGEMAPYPYYPYRIQEGFARLNPPPV